MADRSLTPGEAAAILTRTVEACSCHREKRAECVSCQQTQEALAMAIAALSCARCGELCDPTMELNQDTRTARCRCGAECKVCSGNY